MNKSETIAELAKALVKAQAGFGPLIKGAANPFFKSKYADLSSVMDVARGPLEENGLCFVQTTDDSDPGTVLLETTLIHISGEWVSGRIRMPLVKSDPQSFGSAMTYARRYSLQAILGLAAEDDDAEGAMPRNADKPKSSPKPAPKPADPPPQQNDSGTTVQGYIEKVSTKSGEKGGKPWTQYSAKVNGSWYGTFSDTIGKTMQDCEGREVVIEYTQKGQFCTITELVPVIQE